MKNRKLIWLFFLLFLFLSSYCREVFFESINAMIKGEREFYANTTEISLLSNYSAAELYRLKYIFTIAFSLLFIALTVYGLKFSFKAKFPYQICLGIYGLLVVVAGVLLLISVLSGQFSSVYPYLREMVGMIHNPILFIFMSIAYFSIQTRKEV